jgi:hypothetical protein
MPCTTSLVVLQVATAKILVVKVSTSIHLAHMTFMPRLPCLCWLVAPNGVSTNGA